MQDYRYNTDTCDVFPIAMAYVPRQTFKGIFDNLEEAYKTGTIFPELDLPFTGRRCVS